MKAILRKIRISPKKVNLVAGLVRGKQVNEALSILKFTPKKSAKILYKVVHSAASNAKNNFSQNLDELYITKLLVTKEPTYKRSIPISRGRVHPIRKRTAHITVEVGVVTGEAPKAQDPTSKTDEKEKSTVKKTPAKKVETKAVKKPATKKTTKKTEKKEVKK